MRRSLTSCAAWAISLALALPAAGEVITTPEGAERACEASKAQKGAWMDSGGLARCLSAERASESLVVEVENLKGQRASLESQVTDLTASVTAKDTALTAYQAKDFEQTETIHELEEQVGAWYRNPFVMTTLGFAGGVIAAAAVMVALVSAVN